MPERIPRLELRIIGAGEERNRLIELRDRTFGLQEVVTFSEGFVPVEQIPAMIDDADVGLIPLRISQRHRHHAAHQIARIRHRRHPVHRTENGNDRPLFRRGHGVFFEAENIDSLADAIIELYRDPLRRNRLAQQATERFGSIYRWSEHKKVYTALVDRLLAG